MRGPCEISGFKGCNGVTAPVYYIHSPALQRPVFVKISEIRVDFRSSPCFPLVILRLPYAQFTDSSLNPLSKSPMFLMFSTAPASALASFRKGFTGQKSKSPNVYAGPYGLTALDPKRVGPAIELGDSSKEFAIASPSPPSEERAGERRRHN